ncbi:DNA topoisomerase 3-alpha-like [Camellia sinensis]|uniref:DNA topoisomerase 3-alpha-like n=1 Tax=Camellia sinensis TaxID=4442 RepID=UPI001036A1ED|nr:DNA topoisomerase 3-alpha-like [Camellia sinensis]
MHNMGDLCVAMWKTRIVQQACWFIPTTLTLDSGVTRPPSLLSETDLLNCMDKAGIGADATMHDHIKKLLDRFYATKDFNTRFSPTNLGEALVMGYDDMGYELWKPYLRAMMENDMKAVSIGTKRKAEVLSTCLEQMKACFLDATKRDAFSL